MVSSCLAGGVRAVYGPLAVQFYRKIDNKSKNPELWAQERRFLPPLSNPEKN
jgi:hypothetical protein